MKKIAVLLALAFAAPAAAEPTMLPSHAVGNLLASINPAIQIESLAVTVTTQTEGVAVPKVVILTAGDGTEDAPTAETSGIDLSDLSGVVVLLKTAGTTTATAGGTLQAYTYNPEVAGWYRVPDLDLTAVAATTQSWPAIYVPVRRGRVTWVPNGISAGVTTIYLIGQEK